MRQPTPSDQSYRRLRLHYQVALASFGFMAFAAAMYAEGARTLIYVAAGCGFIVSAFTAFPRAIVQYIRRGYGHRPSLEALFAVVGPLLLGVLGAWMTSQSVRALDYIYNFEVPKWNDLADPWISGSVALMNLGVLVANTISLNRERQGFR